MDCFVYRCVNTYKRWKASRIVYCSTPYSSKPKVVRIHRYIRGAPPASWNETNLFSTFNCFIYEYFQKSFSAVHYQLYSKISRWQTGWDKLQTFAFSGREQLWLNAGKVRVHVWYRSAMYWIWYLQTNRHFVSMQNLLWMEEH